MAKVVMGDEEREVKDGENITEAVEDMGIPIGCSNGTCQVCVCNVEKGAENLSEKTEQENDADLEDNQRLACQCRIKKGEVVLKNPYE